MIKARKGLLTILFATLVFVMAIFGLFFSFDKDTDAVTAQADVGTFSMYDGMAIGVSEHTKNAVSFKVFLSADDVSKLTEATWQEHDHTQRTLYYLAVLRVKEGGVLTGDVYKDGVSLWHSNPDNPYTHLQHANQLTVDSTDNSCVLQAPIPADYNQRYTYSVALIKENWWWRLWDGYHYTPSEYLKTTNGITRSAKEVALQALENDSGDFTETQLAWLQNIAGVNVAENEFPVVVEWQELIYEQWAQYLTRTATFYVNKLYATSKDMVSATVLDLSGAKNEYAFNCRYETEYNSRVVYQAKPRAEWEYRFDETQQKGYLTVTYEDYRYSDFAILLKDNDLSDQVDSTSFVTTTTVGTDTMNGKTYTTLLFSFATIEAQAYESYNWLFEINEENDIHIDNETETVITSTTPTSIWVAFLPEYEDDLRHVLITVTASIIEDYDCTVQVKYAQLDFDGDTIVATEQTETYDMKYSAYMTLVYWSAFKSSEYYVPVAEALLLDKLDGQQYYIPEGADYQKGAEEATFVVTIRYSYNTLFRIVSNNKGVYFISCDSDSKTFTYEELKLAPGEEYRLQSLTSENSSLAEVKFSEDNPQDTIVKLYASPHENRIITLTANYSDSWYLNVNYFETYVNKAGKATPFAVKKQAQFTVKNTVLENLDLDGVKGLLGKTDFKVANTVEPGDIELVFDGASTYTATLVYGVGSLVQLDYNSNRTEIQVPLTPYVDWVTKMGNPKWTIMMLNTAENTWFHHTTDVKREDLYGLFSVAIFKERVTDLNYYFKYNTGDGQMTIFDSLSVAGSKFYKACTELYVTGNTFDSLAGYVGMVFAEAINNDNTMYHSYFFYMDGTNPTDGYISNGGADDAYDDDSAIENAGQDFKDAISGAWGDSSLKSILSIVLACVGVVAFVAGAYWLLSKVGMFDGGKQTTRRRKRK